MNKRILTQSNNMASTDSVKSMASRKAMLGKTFDTKKSLIRLSNLISTIIIAQHPSGFTLDPSDSFKVRTANSFDDDVYLVSLCQCGERFAGNPTSVQILMWLLNHCKEFTQPNHYIGGWRHKDYFYIDVSIEIIGFHQARMFALDNNQIAIYHPASGNNIYTRAA